MTNEDKQAICKEVESIYALLEGQLAALAGHCSGCGNCCDFEKFGHKLFITSPEMLYFTENVKDIKEMTTGQCPYIQGAKCTVRQYRFAGCRIFFCKADEIFQNKLSEETVNKLKKICEKYQLPYRYVDLKTALTRAE